MGKGIMTDQKQQGRAPRPELTVQLDYTKLWKLLIDKGKKRENLKRDMKISSASIARLGRRQNVTTETLLYICQYLDCQIGDICEVVPIQKEA